MSSLNGSTDSLESPDRPEPALVWRYFSELSAIPRCSCREDQVRAWVIDQARALGLEYRQDEAGNVVICKPAVPGRESACPVVLQGHLDMVCEKNRDTVHDFEKDPIRLVREGEWIRADGTTLGADNGIAVAMMLAVLASAEPLGPLECLFTVDEESGLTGAMRLDPALITGRTLINLDSEDEGVFYIGCAGGCNTYVTLPIVQERISAAVDQRVAVTISGLRGGHSGINIQEERGNSIVLGARLLAALQERFPALRLAAITGGGKHNAIPRELYLELVCTNRDELVSLREMVRTMESSLREEIREREPEFHIALGEPSETGGDSRILVLADASFGVLVDLLLAIPHGVLGMSTTIPGLVETSTNLAAVTLEKDHIRILTSQRSSRNSLVDWASRRVAAIATLARGTWRFGERYPAWPPLRESALVDRAVAVYRSLLGKEPTVTVVHAGLECGVIQDRVGEMDIVSFGPDLEGAHTPQERINVPSTERTWNLLLELLRSL